MNFRNKNVSYLRRTSDKVIPLHKKQLQIIKENLTNASWHLYGIERGVGITTMLEKFLTLSPPKKFIALYQDMRLCPNLNEFINELYTICLQKKLRVKKPKPDLKGLRQIFDQLVASNKVIWILDHFDELFSKQRSQSFNRDFFCTLNAIIKLDGVRLLIVTRKPLKDEQYYEIESQRYKPSPIDLPSIPIPRLDKSEAIELLSFLTSKKGQLEEIKQLFFQFDQINKQGYLPVDIFTLHSLITSRLNGGIQIDNKERKKIWKEFCKSRKESAIGIIGRTIGRLVRWVMALLPFKVTLEKLVALIKWAKKI
jgi:preprotein translocase subunit Sss1